MDKQRNEELVMYWEAYFQSDGSVNFKMKGFADSVRAMVGSWKT